MGYADYIIIAVLAVIVSFSVWYICKARKSGKKCIGCPYSAGCGAKDRGGMCSCYNQEN